MKDIPHRISRRSSVLAGVMAGALCLAACGGDGSSAASEYPSERLTWIVPFGAGGGSDILARTVMEILEEEDIYPGDIVVENVEGGSGANGWSEFYAQEGDPYYISSTSASIITTPLQASTDFGPTSFTPVGLVGTDNLLFLTTGDGPASFEEFEQLAKSGDLNIGGQSTVSLDYIVPKIVADQAGFEFTYVPFEDQSTLHNALRSGSVDAIVSNPGEALGQVQDGTYNALYFSGPERLEQLPDVPTTEELGFPVGLGAPRGVILPPDVDPEIQEWWIDAMQRVVETEAWREYLDNNVISSEQVWGTEFNDYLDGLNDEFSAAVDEQSESQQ